MQATKTCEFSLLEYFPDFLRDENHTTLRSSFISSSITSLNSRNCDGQCRHGLRRFRSGSLPNLTARTQSSKTFVDTRLFTGTYEELRAAWYGKTSNVIRNRNGDEGRTDNDENNDIDEDNEAFESIAYAKLDQEYEEYERKSKEAGKSSTEILKDAFVQTLTELMEATDALIGDNCEEEDSDDGNWQSVNAEDGDWTSGGDPCVNDESHVYGVEI
jgi:hypothetical protein